jgi:phage tail P2-like protein
MNDVFTVDFTRALPAPLRNDKKMLALGKTIAAELQTNISMARLAIIYPRIDELEDWLLDILAHDLHVDWYDPDSPIELKREIIKESVRIHKTLGTRPAVERVVTAYFGSGIVRHWYEYGGQPHHFKIVSDNPSITEEGEREFLWILNIVKRLSSWLDEIIISLATRFDIFFGVKVREFNREIHLLMPEAELVLNVKEFIYTRGREAHLIGITHPDWRFYHGQAFRHMTRERHNMQGVQPDPTYIMFGALLHDRTHEKHAIGNAETRTLYGGALHHERTQETHIIFEEDLT